ncbi:30S ribosomal protein S17e [Candidatus Woesearchaeota archaeon]|nr:30S ribosomal protein S17e [Candidatus Woesearchaeota archaeon]
MGRIKTRVLKSATRDILERHGDKFDTDFEKNKLAVNEAADISSKKLRNIIAGYATRLKKLRKY